MSSAEPPLTGVHHAAVIGSPIGHSRSPALHRAGLAAAGLHGWRFDAIECDADGVAPLVAGLDPSWAGLAVTMPGKAAAAAVADRRSDRVEQLGVANTLYRRSSGWAAENTDVDGVVGSVRAVGVAAVGRALVLGGGGTAMAVLAALAELGATSVVLAGRRPESTADAAELAARLGMAVRTIGYDVAAVAEVAPSVDIAVSTVPGNAADVHAPALAPENKKNL